MMSSSVTLCDEAQREVERNSRHHLQKLFGGMKKQRIKSEEEFENFRSSCDSEMLIRKLELQLQKPIKFDDEEEADVDCNEDFEKFDQLIENLLKKNEQLRQTSHDIMSEQVKATFEASNMTVGLQKNFEEALSYYDNYAKRIGKVRDYQEMNRTAYLDELQTIRDNFVKDSKGNRQKHKELTLELQQGTQKILKHPSLPKLEEGLKNIYATLDEMTK